jgi:copper chaperone
LLDSPIVGSLNLSAQLLEERTMIAFKVEDMTCGHCASVITRAVKEVDKEAQVRVDVGAHLVEIEPKASDAGVLREAISEAGYTPVEI